MYASRKGKVAGRFTKVLFCLLFLFYPMFGHAYDSVARGMSGMLLVVCCIVILLFLLFWLFTAVRRLKRETEMAREKKRVSTTEYLGELNQFQLTQLTTKVGLVEKTISENENGQIIKIITLATFTSFLCLAQDVKAEESGNPAMTSPGMWIMVVLVIVPVIGAIVFAVMGLKRVASAARYKRLQTEAKDLAREMEMDEVMMGDLAFRKQALDFR